MQSLWRRKNGLLRRKSTIRTRRSNQSTASSAPIGTFGSLEVDSSLRDQDVTPRSTPERQRPMSFNCFIGYLPLGRDWAVDLVGLPHNAVRRELRGLYYLVNHAERANAELLQDAQHWFKWLGSFLECAFAIEERCIFQWLARAGARLPELMGSSQRALRLARVRTACNDVVAALRTGSGLAHAVDKLVNVLLSHFAAVESVVPQIIRATYDPATFNSVVEQMSRPLAEALPEMFLILARGYVEVRLVDEFIEKYGRRENRAEFRTKIKEFEARRIEELEQFIKKANNPSILRAPSGCAQEA